MEVLCIDKTRELHFTNEECKDMTYNAFTGEMEWEVFLDRYYNSKDLRDYVDKAFIELLSCQEFCDYFKQKMEDRTVEHMILCNESLISKSPHILDYYRHPHCVSFWLNRVIRFLFEPYKATDEWYSDLERGVYDHQFYHYGFDIPFEYRSVSVLGYIYHELYEKNFKGQEHTSFSRSLNALIKKNFKCKNKQLPQWVGFSNWPLINGKPGVFIKSEVDEDCTYHYFMDDTETETYCVRESNELDEKILKDKKIAFMFEAVPDYIDGPDVWEYVEKEIIAKLPEGLTFAQKIKACKEKIKDAFYLSEKGAKRPSWAQEGEWPIINGKPCKYLSRRRDGDKVEYIFEDVDTHEQVIVEQFY